MREEEFDNGGLQTRNAPPRADNPGKILRTIIIPATDLSFSEISKEDKQNKRPFNVR